MTGFAHVRPVDFDRLAALPAGERFSQKLIDEHSGARNAVVSYVRTPPGGGSPRGAHTHEFEQLFYLLEGRMAIEVAGQRMDVEPGSLIVFPAGVPHRNWNTSDEPTVHIAINTPVIGRP
ncbi:MAG TPA: cupin domain-containing protein [Pseudonocardiaceae bacterium]|nr:cupin domain-containing protein [Pseudonocardiaceae bacterium]